jgi:tRNA pseudouridine38-40 synthase
VVAFNLEWHHSSSNLRNALNANLPDDIVIREIQEVSADFHPRYDALRRSYQYQLYIAPVRDPLRRLRAWRLARELDEVAICVAAKHLEGTHDFSTFGVPPRGENAVRTVYEVDWQSSPDGQYTFTIVANAFLYRMVRSVVATLVWVGKGHMTEKEFQGILAARQRSLAAPPAPPYGLTLVAVHFTD